MAREGGAHFAFLLAHYVRAEPRRAAPLLATVSKRQNRLPAKPSRGYVPTEVAG